VPRFLYVVVYTVCGEREKLYNVKAKHFALWCAQTIYLLLNYSALACDLQKIALAIINIILNASSLPLRLPPHRSKPRTIGQPVEWGVGGTQHFHCPTPWHSLTFHKYLPSHWLFLILFNVWFNNCIFKYIIYVIYIKFNYI